MNRLRVSPDHSVHYGKTRGGMGGVSRAPESWSCECGKSKCTSDSGVKIPADMRCGECGSSLTQDKA